MDYILDIVFVGLILIGGAIALFRKTTNVLVFLGTFIISFCIISFGLRQPMTDFMDVRVFNFLSPSLGEVGAGVDSLTTYVRDLIINATGSISEMMDPLVLASATDIAKGVFYIFVSVFSVLVSFIIGLIISNTVSLIIYLVKKKKQENKDETRVEIKSDENKNEEKNSGKRSWNRRFISGGIGLVSTAFVLSLVVYASNQAFIAHKSLKTLDVQLNKCLREEFIRYDQLSEEVFSFIDTSKQSISDLKANVPEYYNFMDAINSMLVDYEWIFTAAADLNSNYSQSFPVASEKVRVISNTINASLNEGEAFLKTFDEKVSEAEKLATSVENEINSYVDQIESYIKDFDKTLLDINNKISGLMEPDLSFLQFGLFKFFNDIDFGYLRVKDEADKINKIEDLFDDFYYAIDVSFNNAAIAYKADINSLLDNGEKIYNDNKDQVHTELASIKETIDLTLRDSKKFLDQSNQFLNSQAQIYPRP